MHAWFTSINGKLVQIYAEITLLKLWFTQNWHIINEGGKLSIFKCLVLHQYIVHWFDYIRCIQFAETTNVQNSHIVNAGGKFSTCACVVLYQKHFNWFICTLNLLCPNCDWPKIRTSSIQIVSLVFVHAWFYINKWVTVACVRCNSFAHTVKWQKFTHHEYRG